MARRTKTDEEMEAAVQQFSDDPERQHMLQVARKFKASWIELAESLSKIRRGEQWRNWGYPSFDAYAKTELKLRQDTIDKLTGAYLFLQKRRPESLQQPHEETVQELPSYQTLDFLRRAEEQSSAPREVVAEMVAKALDEGVSLPKLKKEYGSVVFPVTEQDSTERDKAAIRNVGSRLSSILEQSNVVPLRLSLQIRELLLELLELVAEKDEASAAE
jgi:hypothetical protein